MILMTVGIFFFGY